MIEKMLLIAARIEKIAAEFEDTLRLGLGDSDLAIKIVVRAIREEMTPPTRARTESSEDSQKRTRPFEAKDTRIAELEAGLLAIKNEIGGVDGTMVAWLIASELLRPTLADVMITEDPSPEGQSCGSRAPVLSNMKEEEAPYTNMTEASCEQQARDLLERVGVEGAQVYGNEDLTELTNLIAASITVRDAIMSEVKTVTGAEACNLDDALKLINRKREY